MRISDWSSDVCSSDLVGRDEGAVRVDQRDRVDDPRVGGRRVRIVRGRLGEEAVEKLLDMRDHRLPRRELPRESDRLHIMPDNANTLRFRFLRKLREGARRQVRIRFDETAAVSLRYPDDRARILVRPYDQLEIGR